MRLRSIDNILAEITDLYHTYGYKGFMFYDDELNVNPKFVQFMQALVSWQEVNGVRLALRGFIKSELFTTEQARWMRQAGFAWVLCGFESGAERILANINKRASVGDNTRCVEIAHAHGLKVKALMSMGHAGESAQTIADTEEWLLSVKPDDFDLTIITPYPGTPYYDESIPHGAHWKYVSPKTGDVLYSTQVDYLKEADYYKGVPGEYVSHVWTDHLSSQELVEFRDVMDDSLRSRLRLTRFIQTLVTSYEHSMGQSLPPHILKRALQEVS